MTQQDAGPEQTERPGAEPPRSEHDHLEAAREKLLEAALAHVPFDGWSERTFKAAIHDAGVDPGLARLAFPRGGIDMALYFHRRADRQLAEELAREDLSAMRIRERIVHAVRRRIEIVAPHREAVRRAAALFALPIYAPEGARALWETVDTIWKAVGDESRDINWYTKRLTLGAVYSATLLYWLGDASPGFTNTWAFLDRRIDEVMRFEKAKAALRDNPLVKAAFWGPMQLAKLVRAPRTADVPAPGGDNHRPSPPASGADPAGN